MLYNDESFNLEMYSAGAEWTSLMREEALSITDTSENTSRPAAKNGLVTLAVVTSLFLLSIGTLAFGTVKVAEGFSNLSQPLASMRFSSW